MERAGPQESFRERPLQEGSSKTPGQLSDYMEGAGAKAQSWPAPGYRDTRAAPVWVQGPRWEGPPGSHPASMASQVDLPAAAAGAAAVTAALLGAGVGAVVALLEVVGMWGEGAALRARLVSLGCSRLVVAHSPPPRNCRCTVRDPEDIPSVPSSSALFPPTRTVPGRAPGPRHRRAGRSSFWAAVPRREHRQPKWLRLINKNRM